MSLKIRAIKKVAFHKSEYTLLRDFEAENPEIAASMGPNDVLVFVSCRGEQMMFVHNYVPVLRKGDKPGEEKRVVKSSRHRVLTGTWDPLMLRSYAKDAGLDIRGLKEFENHYRQLLQEQAAGANHGT